MSQENVDAVRAVYERWGRGDMRASMDVFDPFVLLVLRPEFPDAGPYIGVERIAEYTRALLDAWERFSIEAEEFIEAGDSVVVAVRQRATGRDSGVETEFPYFQVWTFRGPKVVRLESIRDRADALEAVGLSE